MAAILFHKAGKAVEKKIIRLKEPKSGGGNSGGGSNNSTAPKSESEPVKTKEGEAESGNSKVYRTQGGELPNASQHRILVDQNGNLKIDGEKMLYVTIDDAAHQVYFYEKRGGSVKNAEIVSFEIPESLAKEIKAQAVPQDLGKANPTSPQISDPSKSTGAYGLPKEWIKKLESQAIPGTAKIEKP